MTRREKTWRVTDVPAALSERQRRRKRWYFTMMGVCILLIVLAWNVVRLFSTGAAVAMTIVAAVIPPVAAFIANSSDGG